MPHPDDDRVTPATLSDVLEALKAIRSRLDNLERRVDDLERRVGARAAGPVGRGPRLSDNVTATKPRRQPGAAGPQPPPPNVRGGGAGTR